MGNDLLWQHANDHKLSQYQTLSAMKKHESTDLVSLLTHKINSLRAVHLCVTQVT